MKFSKIRQCSTHFGYGEIADSVIAESFLWTENELVSTATVLKHIKENCNYSRVHFFTNRYCNYPLSFRDKHFGLWKNLEQETGFSGKKQQEYLLQLNRYAQFLGVTEVPENQIHIALELLMRNFMYSFMFFSSSDFDLLLSNNDSFKITNSDFSLDFSDIINRNCANGLLVTCINGSNGTTFNCFHSL